MISVKDFDSIGRKCKCDGCAETTCRQNALFVPSSALPTRFGIPTDRSPNILGLIADDETDVVLRYWVKQTFVEKKILPTPTELHELLKGKGVKDAMPISAVQAVLDAFEWPAYVLDQRRKEALADFGRQLSEHGYGSVHISFA